MSTNSGHLHCHACQLDFKSHSAHLTHVANTHPCHLDSLSVGRLGNAVFYQPTARLFHCSLCFHTSNCYPQIYDHLLASHCLSEKGREKEEREMDEGEMLKEGEREEGEMLKGKREKGEVEEGEMLKEGERVKGEMEEGAKPDDMKDGEQKVEDEDGQTSSDAALNSSSQTQEDEGERKDSCEVSLKRKRRPAIVLKDADEDEDEAIDPTQEQQEREVLDRYSLYSGNRYVCRLCGWKSKMKGFIMSHIVRSHNVPKPFSCQHCDRSYILQSQLNSHTSLWHRQGLYQCPFCLFSSDVLRGMRRHCTRCSTRLEGEGSEGAPGWRERAAREHQAGGKGQRGGTRLEGSEGAPGWRERAARGHQAGGRGQRGGTRLEGKGSEEVPGSRAVRGHQAGGRGQQGGTRLEGEGSEGEA